MVKQPMLVFDLNSPGSGSHISRLLLQSHEPPLPLISYSQGEKFRILLASRPPSTNVLEVA